MFGKFVRGVFFAGLLANAADAEPAPLTPAAARGILKGCGPAEAVFANLPDRAWQPIASGLPDHAKLRQALGADLPAASTMVMIYASGGDLQTTTFSLILTRAASGKWHGSAVGETRIWIKDAAPNVTPPRQWDLFAETGKRLDELLADPCLYAEPGDIRDNSQPPAIGALGMKIETITPERRHVGFAFGNELAGYLRQIFVLARP